MTKPKVLISVPNHYSIHSSMMPILFEMAKDKRADTALYFPVLAPYVNNLHHIVKMAINEEFDYWINIDSDNTPFQSPVDLIFQDKDIVGCPTPVWKTTMGHKEYTDPIHYNVYMEDGEEYIPWMPELDEDRKMRGMHRVDAVGTGCIVIARRVLLKIQAPFMREWNEDGTQKMGNDMMFCKRAKEAGFEVWANFSYPCSHFSEVNLFEVAAWGFSRGSRNAELSLIGEK